MGKSHTPETGIEFNRTADKQSYGWKRGVRGGVTQGKPGALRKAALQRKQKEEKLCFSEKVSAAQKLLHCLGPGILRRKSIASHQRSNYSA